jgi:hypothetical protein
MGGASDPVQFAKGCGSGDSGGVACSAGGGGGDGGGVLGVEPQLHFMIFYLPTFSTLVFKSSSGR